MYIYKYTYNINIVATDFTELANIFVIYNTFCTSVLVFVGVLVLALGDAAHALFRQVEGLVSAVRIHLEAHDHAEEVRNI